MRRKTIALVLAGITATAGLVAATAALAGAGSRGATTSGAATMGGTAVTGGGTAVDGGSTNGCVVVGNGNSCVGPSPSETDPDYAARIRGTARPTGPGPWQFVVVYDEGLGLKIRSTPDRTGVQTGYAPARNPVWVECQTVSDFDPEPGNPAGARWYQVRWPTATPNTESNVSGPADPATGWAYSAYLAPVGTDGDVPACPAAAG